MCGIETSEWNEPENGCVHLLNASGAGDGYI